MPFVQYYTLLQVNTPVLFERTRSELAYLPMHIKEPFALRSARPLFARFGSLVLGNLTELADHYIVRRHHDIVLLQVVGRERARRRAVIDAVCKGSVLAVLFDLGIPVGENRKWYH